MTWIIVATLGLGVLTGTLLPANLAASLDNLTTLALCLLIFGVGVELGRERQVLDCLRKEGWTALLIPVLIAGGSLLGTFLYSSLFSALPWAEGVTVGAGLGWYSLIGPLVSELHSSRLGAVAFLANSLREIISIIIIPFVAKYLGPKTAIAPSGAAAMDVTLPLISRVTNPETAILAFVSGAFLSFLVPVLVPLILQLV